MPRRKITPPAVKPISGNLPDLPDLDLPDLTPQQMAFVQNILAGQRSGEAYRNAYNCSHWTYFSIAGAATKLRRHPAVAKWLAAARQACLGTAVVTRDAHLAELERLREIALENGNIGAAVQAEHLRGKVAGHHVERVQDVTEHDPVTVLREIAAVQPDLAKALAVQHGINWTADDSASAAVKH